MRIASWLGSTLLVVAIGPGCGDSLSEAMETGESTGEEGAEGESSADTSGESSASSSDENGDGDGDDDWSGGDGDGDSSGDGDGDGDSGSSTGDGDGSTGDGDGDGSTGDGDGDGDSGSGTGDGDGGDPACTQTHEWEIDVGDPAVSAMDWSFFMSESDTGMYISPNDNTGDSPAAFTIEIPCEDSWHIWARGWDEGSNDSFFLQLDGVPADETTWIFDFDCSGEGSSWKWQHLNERPEQGCDISAGNDYDANLNAGSHTLNFFDRENADLSRIWITNDPLGTPF